MCGLVAQAEEIRAVALKVAAKYYVEPLRQHATWQRQHSGTKAGADIQGGSSLPGQWGQTTYVACGPLTPLQLEPFAAPALGKCSTHVTLLLRALGVSSSR